MAPGLTTATPPEFRHDRNGTDLETLCDKLEEVNILKAKLQSSSSSSLAIDTPDSASTSAPSSPTTTAFDSLSTLTATADASTFRQYASASSSVKSFYLEQHTKQTVAYNLKARHLFHSKVRARMTVWEAIEKLNTLIDESDPDTDQSQIEHLLQTAEAIRRDGKPRWMQLTGLVHDLGKLMYFFDAEGQWDVVGDTFPVGCAFDPANIYPHTFTENPDFSHPLYSTQHGIYTPNCGIDSLMISWGHDEYIYQICKSQSTIPPEGLSMLRYHSFYPWHNAGGYRYFMKEGDEEILNAVKAFNPYDLYSKADEKVEGVEALKPYYLELIDEFFPKKVVEW